MKKKRLLWASLVYSILLLPRASGNHIFSSQLSVALRAYYRNDQRIFWSGLESTFLAEGRINFSMEKRLSWTKIRLRSSVFLNQPYGKSILVDEERVKYLPNFQKESLEISEMNISLEGKNLRFSLGKFFSPFGRVYFPLLTNELGAFSPFLRSEVVLWRETGVLLEWKPLFFDFAAALVNGEEDGDTNSDKALILRLGIKTRHISLGFSSKTQDGIGSEFFKKFNNYYGMDFLVKLRGVSLFGEVVHDWYGLWKPQGEERINWPRSLYYRDIFYKYKTPIKGWGGYMNFAVVGKTLELNLNYGVYYPQRIGNPYHDEPIKRGILYLVVKNRGLKVFSALLLESKRPREPWRSGEKGIAGILGLEFERLF